SDVHSCSASPLLSRDRTPRASFSNPRNSQFHSISPPSSVRRLPKQSFGFVLRNYDRSWLKRVPTSLCSRRDELQLYKPGITCQNSARCITSSGSGFHSCCPSS